MEVVNSSGELVLVAYVQSNLSLRNKLLRGLLIAEREDACLVEIQGIFLFPGYSADAAKVWIPKELVVGGESG